MRNLKVFSVLLLTLGLTGLLGGNSLLLADETDPTYQTHLDLLRGPGMGGAGSPFWYCHTSGTPGTGDVYFTVCEPCYRLGGAFDGVEMAKDNWGGGVYEAGAILIIRPASLLVLLT